MTGAEKKPQRDHSSSIIAIFSDDNQFQKSGWLTTSDLIRTKRGGVRRGVVRKWGRDDMAITKLYLLPSGVSAKCPRRYLIMTKMGRDFLFRNSPMCVALIRDVFTIRLFIYIYIHIHYVVPWRNIHAVTESSRNCLLVCAS